MTWLYPQFNGVKLSVIIYGHLGLLELFDSSILVIGWLQTDSFHRLCKMYASRL